MIVIYSSIVFKQINGWPMKISPSLACIILETVVGKKVWRPPLLQDTTLAPYLEMVIDQQFSEPVNYTTSDSANSSLFNIEIMPTHHCSLCFSLFDFFSFLLSSWSLLLRWKVHNLHRTDSLNCSMLENKYYSHLMAHYHTKYFG